MNRVTIQVRFYSLNWLATILIIPTSHIAHGQVLPPNAVVGGMTMSEWQVESWRWILESPADENPAADTTGEYSHTGDRGSVFLVNGTFGGPTITRTATVRDDQHIFVGLLNSVLWGPPRPVSPPPEADLRSSITADVDETDELFIEIDGVVPDVDLFDYRIPSPPGFFDFTLPENNVLEIPAGVYPAISDGHSIMLEPLTPGLHTIEFGGSDFDFASSVIYNLIVVEGTNGDSATTLQAGDADQDLDFDQLDLVEVQIAAKYLSGQVATWGEGDWNGAPGGEPGNPPAGNGLFDQLDVIAALGAGTYLTGPYAAVSPASQTADGQASIIYNTGTGEIAIDAPASVELTSINIDSAAGIFTGETAQDLGGSFDNDADGNIFKATFGGSFGSLSFGNVAQAGLSEDYVLGDLTVIGSLAGGGDLGNVDLVYVPEPASVLLLSVGLAIWLLHFRRVNL